MQWSSGSVWESDDWGRRNLQFQTQRCCIWFEFALVTCTGFCFWNCHCARVAINWSCFTNVDSLPSSPPAFCFCFFLFFLKVGLLKLYLGFNVNHICNEYEDLQQREERESETKKRKKKSVVPNASLLHLIWLSSCCLQWTLFLSYRFGLWYHQLEFLHKVGLLPHVLLLLLFLLVLLESRFAGIISRMFCWNFCVNEGGIWSGVSEICSELCDMIQLFAFIISCRTHPRFHVLCQKWKMNRHSEGNNFYSIPDWMYDEEFIVTTESTYM